MSLIRAVKATGGGISDFWSDGVTDAPYDLVLAINIGLQVLSWFENLPEKEQPPRHIWWSDELLSDWFENVREQRNAESSGSGKSHRTSWDTGEDVPLVENELAAGLRPNGR